MCAAIENPASCELRTVIRFLFAKYGNNAISESSVRKWCIRFKNGRVNVHDEEKSGRPSILSDELVAKVDEKIRENRRFTIRELSLSFPQVSMTVLFEIVTQQLGYHKFCARWVPKVLTDHHKEQRMGAALTFLEAYHSYGDSLLDRIVTGDETWVKHVNCETKLQSMEWRHTSSPNLVSKKI